jgi:signal transduction histidine kinase
MSTARRTHAVAPRVGHVVFPLARMRSRERVAVARALADERRRMAAEVHDLIMQDLAFALATARTLVDDPALAPQASIVVAAGERALAGAREVVGALLNQDRKPVIETVETVVRVAARGVPLRFDAKGALASAQPDPLTFDTLVHIGRETVTNAVKHADPLGVEVLLTHAEEWHLRVSDDGRGFDTANTDGGFGLESMRRHAQALGGSLHVTSAIGAPGTIVEAILP